MTSVGLRPRVKLTQVERETILIVSLVMLAISPLFYLLVFPSPLGWWITITFENASGEPIFVTPIGIDETGEMGPISAVQGGLLTRPPNRHIPLAAGANLSFTYDWDDQNLQFALIERSTGDVKILAIDGERWRAHGYLRCCGAPDRDHYVIPAVATLPDAPSALLPTLQGRFVEFTP